MSDKCKWRKTGSSPWQGVNEYKSQCGISHINKLNFFRFCPSCGKEIEEVKK